MGMWDDYKNFALGPFGGDISRQYDNARRDLDRGKAQQEKVMNPFYKGGTQALGNYQDWLSGQKDPSSFINNLMGGYEQSPYARYQTDQMERTAKNMGSASGLMGSTPLTKFAQQQAQGIASGDMNQWLQNVLGINTQYGEGQKNIAGMGQDSANRLFDMYGQDAANRAGMGLREGGDQSRQYGQIFETLAKMFM